MMGKAGVELACVDSDLKVLWPAMSSGCGREQ